MRGGRPAQPVLRVLELAHAEGVHDVPYAPDQGEGTDPGDQEDGAPAVVAGRPEGEEDLDDPADELQPPDTDLVLGGDRLDDVERAGEEQEEADETESAEAEA